METIFNNLGFDFHILNGDDHNNIFKYNPICFDHIKNDNDLKERWINVLTNNIKKVYHSSDEWWTFQFETKDGLVFCLDLYDIKREKIRKKVSEDVRKFFKDVIIID